MKLTLFSNFLNHHQKPVCDEFYKHLGEDFRFVSTIPIPENFLKGGYDDLTATVYNINAFESQQKHEEALRLGLDSDIVISGSSPEKYLMERLRQNKHTFRYGERDFKKGAYQLFDARKIYGMLKLHTRYRTKNLYMLCNSAYKVNDLRWVFAYPNKTYKWGYFPKVEKIDIDVVLNAKNQDKIKLIYVSRLIDWKHPELVVKLAHQLKNNGYSFSLNIYGSGDLQARLKKMVSLFHLDEHVHMKGNVPNSEILDEMKKSNIFLFTSNRNEGWGAVANEAMASGCTLVAGNEIGAVPYLVKNKVNGLVFLNENENDLFIKVESLILNREFCDTLARNAYLTVSTLWSPQNAAKSFLKLSEAFLTGEKIKIKEGPCSIAKPTKKKWFN
jgi:glycosyltransferase involved in cell wall biosynthesis